MIDSGMVDSGIDVQNKIMYNNKDYFQIVPKLDANNAKAYRKYFDNTKFKDKKYFFWSIDYENSIIKSNNSASVVFSDVINQLAIILRWIFENGYSIRGYYYYRVGFTIGCISINNSKKIIDHMILLDKINIDEIPNLDSVAIEELMDDGIDKINSAMIDNAARINGIEKDIILEEHTLIIESMQNRLITVENKMKSHDEFNMYISRYCTIVGLIMAGSFIAMYSLSARDNS